jgi:hypothetical protein
MTWSQHAIDNGVLSSVLIGPDGATFAEFVAQRPHSGPLEPRADARYGSLILSRFAFMHRGTEGAALESPTSSIRADLSPAAARVVSGFAAAFSIEAAVASAPPEAARRPTPALAGHGGCCSPPGPAAT